MTKTLSLHHGYLLTVSLMYMYIHVVIVNGCIIQLYMYTVFLSLPVTTSDQTGDGRTHLNEKFGY